MSSFVWHHVAPCAGNQNGVGDQNGNLAVGSGATGERCHTPEFLSHPVFRKHTGGPKPPPVAPVRVWHITGIGLLAVALGIGLSGCGGKSGPTLVQLSGTILFEGRPIPPGTLTFILRFRRRDAAFVRAVSRLGTVSFYAESMVSQSVANANNSCVYAP